MFKQILIIVLIIVLSYFVIKNVLIVFHKLYLSEFVVKYTLSDSDKKFIKLYSNQTTINDLNEDVNIFYTTFPWTTKNNNYIHDIKNDRYYIIDSGYYYYLPNSKDYQLTINNKTLIINLFDNKNIIK